MQSLLTCRQTPKIIGLSGGRGEFCFQVIYFNLCHPSELNFLSLKSNFFSKTWEVPLILSGELRAKVHVDVAHRWACKGVLCPGCSKGEPQKLVSSVLSHACKAPVEIL